MNNITSDWKTSELIEFLNSYNRVFNENHSKTIQYRDLYVNAFAELQYRQPLMSLLY